MAMDDEGYKALTKIKYVFDQGLTPGAMVAEYDKWASDYEKDVAAIGYKVQWPVAEALLKHMPACSLENGKIVDVACGTGLVGDALRENGFQGVLHGIDGSENMVSFARDRGCYDELIVQMMHPHQPITTPEKYDGLTCVGAFTKNHFPAKILPRFVDLLVVGGVLSFSIRDSDDNADLLKQLRTEIGNLKESKAVVEISTVETTYDVNWNVEEASGDKTGNSSLHIFVLRKL